MREEVFLNATPVIESSRVVAKMDKNLNQDIDRYYKMDHKHRGLAIIFNNEEFDDTEYPTRHGTQVDCDNLKRTFESLSFKVKVYNDQYKSEMKRTLQKGAYFFHEEGKIYKHQH